MILTVFHSRLRQEAQAEYGELAPQMSKLARSMPGYKSHKVFIAEDGERLTLVEFEDDATKFDWASHPEHRAAPKRGQSAFYSEYSLQICEVKRESRFSASEENCGHSRILGW
tara:strand:+ start:1485 stop:1823 length:339 start_codon:yes stop_codon:yes gene_type:complete